jgi:hypothetical protein
METTNKPEMEKTATLTPAKPERQFKLNDIVESDTLNGHFLIIAFWWTDEAYGSKNGSWVYRLAFMTKNGSVDKRKNYRQFEENRLTIIENGKH